MSAVLCDNTEKYYIYEYPTGRSENQYRFVVKEMNHGALITASAHELIYHYPDIVKQLSIKESNNLHFYLGLEIANHNDKLQLAIQTQR